MCVLTTHALLHVADDILDSGPVWSTWTFVMERYCGSLLPAVKSKLNPYSALAAHATRMAQLNILGTLYRLETVLDIKKRANLLEPSGVETCYEECKYPLLLLLIGDLMYLQIHSASYVNVQRDIFCHRISKGN
jgi:hypothetical protein